MGSDDHSSSFTIATIIFFIIFAIITMSAARYEAAEDFLADVDLICTNALEYNPDTTEVGREIRHRACMLRDQVWAGTATG